MGGGLAMSVPALYLEKNVTEQVYVTRAILLFMKGWEVPLYGAYYFEINVIYYPALPREGCDSPSRA